MAERYRQQVKTFAGQMNGSAAPVPAPMGAEEPDEGTSPKLSPESQGYRPSAHCEVCHFYLPSQLEDSGFCQIVAGSIDGDWVCNRFMAKDAQTRPGGLLMWPT